MTVKTKTETLNVPATSKQEEDNVSIVQEVVTEKPIKSGYKEIGNEIYKWDTDTKSWIRDIKATMKLHMGQDWQNLPTIVLDEFYVPFYNKAVVAKVREELHRREFIEVILKGSRYSGKSYAIANTIVELSYRDWRRSTVVLAKHINEHYERGVKLFTNVLSELGYMQEWKWISRTTKPKLTRSVNGYIQEIAFMSFAEIETAGLEPPVNDATGKAGFYANIWVDEPAKKEDNNPDADFSDILRMMDAIDTLKNTIIRHIPENGGAICIFYTLNPWGGGNPVVQKFHKLLPDNYEKLVKQGYNLAYEDDDETYRIYATTNYQINSKLSKKNLKAVRANRNSPRAETQIFGKTGRTLNSWFSRELTVMEGLNKTGNIPEDQNFYPMNISMDVGKVSAIYLNGYDTRYTVLSGGKRLPTRAIVKGEYYSDVEKEVVSAEVRYKNMLKHIHRLAIRFPQMKAGGKKSFKMFVDGSALDAIELMKAFAKDLQNEDLSFDFSWLDIIPQSNKWTTAERRTARKSNFADMVASFMLIVDKRECPKFYEETSKIMSSASEDKYDHCYDAMMYGIMPLKGDLITGYQVRAIQGKKVKINGGNNE